MAAIMISVDGINCDNLSCNKRGVHIWAEERSPSIATDAPPASAHPTKTPKPFKPFEEWEIPRELPESVRSEPVEECASTPPSVLSSVPAHSSTSSERTGTEAEVSARTAAEIHQAWWALRIARQQAIDASIAAKAEFEYLYDKPYEDKKKVRVAGPFTVESLSPHRTLVVDENDELVAGDQWSVAGQNTDHPPPTTLSQ